MGAKFCICIAILILSICLMLINKKLRCVKIIENLIQIFYGNRTNKLSIFDIICFFICPTVVGASIVIGFDYYFSNEVANALLTIFSILFTLLFGVMSLLISSLNSSDSNKKKTSNEAFTALSFAMLISLIALLLIIIYIALLEKIESTICFQIMSGAIITIATNMVMLFFMIIKRSYVTSIDKIEP